MAADLDYSSLSHQLEGWSGSDIRTLCKEAAMHPLRALLKTLELDDTTKSSDDLKMDPVTRDDVAKALETVRPAPQATPQKYTEWKVKFGSQ